MKHITLFVGLFLTLSCCQYSNNKSYTLSHKQMVNLLCDLHIAEGAAELLEGTKKDSILKIYYTQIFEIQGIEEKQFKKDLDLLKEDPTEMTKVYKWVNDSLAARSKRIQSGGYSPN